MFKKCSCKNPILREKIHTFPVKTAILGDGEGITRYTGVKITCDKCNKLYGWFNKKQADMIMKRNKGDSKSC